MNKVFIRVTFQVLTAIVLIFSMTITVHAEQESESAPSAGAASDPTAAVNFQDVRFRYIDLGDGKQRRWLNTEGGYMLTPNFKLINELHYWDTDITGTSESSLESFHLKGIYLTPGPQIGDVKSRFAVGMEWIKALGEAKYGTSFGTDQIAPLTGFGWMLSKQATLITLVQYFHSYREQPGVEPFRVTGPRIIYLHSFPSQKAWLRLDDKFAINHNSGNATSNALEVQLGKMVTPKLGVYVDALYNTGGFHQYDWGVGMGIRTMY